MQHARISLIVLATGLVLLLQPVFGQKRKVDVRALLGYTAGLEDTPPHAWVGGGSVTAAVGPRLRLGVEVLQANMLGIIYLTLKRQVYNPRSFMRFSMSPRAQ